MRADVIREGDLADIVGSADVDPILNDELSALYELMVASFEDYSVTSAASNITAGQSSVALPATFYKARDLDDLRDAAHPVSLPRFEWADRNRVTTKSYAIVGSNLLVRPITLAPGNYTLHFVPQYTALVADGDTFSCPNRWHMLAVLNAAARFRAIQDLDSSQLEARADIVRKRIEAAAKQRDAGNPQVARDVRPRYRPYLVLPGEED